MEDDQQINLKWCSHQHTMISSFKTFLQNGSLVDCTLAAEGKYLKAHKMVLSACSPYFATLLDQPLDKHPIFILKDIKFHQIKAIMDYMYLGEMNIDEDLLPSILQAADSLQIKGLCRNVTSPEYPDAAPPTTAITESRAVPKSRYKSAPSPKAATLSPKTSMFNQRLPASRPPFPPKQRPKQKPKREMKAKHLPLNDQQLPVKLVPELVHPTMDIDHGPVELKANVTELLPPPEPSKYVCRRCHRAYTSLTSLGRHRRVECNKKPALKCPHCIYKSMYRWNLKRHMMKYHKDKFSEDVFDALIRKLKRCRPGTADRMTCV